MESTTKKTTTEYEIKVDDKAKTLSHKIETQKLYRLELQFKDGQYENLLTNLILKTRTENDLDGLDEEKLLEKDGKILKMLNEYIQREIDWVESGDSYRSICNTMLESAVMLLFLRRPLFIRIKTPEGIKKLKNNIAEMRNMITSAETIPAGTLTRIFDELLGVRFEDVKIIVKEVRDGYQD